MRTCIGLDIHRELAEVGVSEGGTVRSAPRCPAADLFGHKGRAWLQEQELPADERQAVAALLRKLDLAGEELRLVDAEFGRVALEREEVKRLTTIPGVAATVALSIVAAVDDFHRFSSPPRLVATSASTRACASREASPPSTDVSPSRAGRTRVGCSSRRPSRPSCLIGLDRLRLRPTPALPSLAALLLKAED